MTTYLIATKTDTQSSIGAVTIGVETTVVSYAAQAADYIPEVYLSLQNMVSGDTTVVTEYIAVDGTNFEIFYQNIFTGAQTAPILRFHGKLIELNALYKITVKQTAGTGRSYPYTSILQVFNA
jgi:hypothetical protein